MAIKFSVFSFFLLTCIMSNASFLKKKTLHEINRNTVFIVIVRVFCSGSLTVNLVMLMVKLSVMNYFI